MAIAITPLDKSTLQSDNAMSVYTQLFFEQNLPLLTLLPKGFTIDGTFKTKVGPVTLDDLDLDDYDYDMSESAHYPDIDKIPFTDIEGQVNDLGFQFPYTTKKLNLQPSEIIASIQFHLMNIARRLNAELFEEVAVRAPTYDVPYQANDAGAPRTFAQLPFVYFQRVKLHYDAYGLPIIPNVFILSASVFDDYQTWLAGANSGSFSYTGLNGYTAPTVYSAGVELDDGEGNAIDYIAFDNRYPFGRLIVEQETNGVNISGLNTVDTTVSLPANARVPISYVYSKSPDLNEEVITRVRAKLGYQALNPIVSIKGSFLEGP